MSASLVLHFYWVAVYFDWIGAGNVQIQGDFSQQMDKKTM